MLTRLTAALAEDLAGQVPQAALREISDSYLTEPRGMWRGQAGAVVAPGTTGEVATVIRFAAAHRVPVIPRGGGTGLVGGQVMPEGPTPILLSLERMTAIRGIWPEENAMTVEAGAILADVQNAAAGADRLFPLSLASEGTARIGGLLATNAGGVGVLRYGNARDLVLGIEAVLPDGSVLNGLRRLRKDNTGYDLRHLLIGAEGTLGVITGASLRLFPRPAAQGTALLVVESPAAALSLLSLAQRKGGVSAFELISGQGMTFQRETGIEVQHPFDPPPAWSVLVELDLPEDGGEPRDRLEALFVEGVEAGLVSDGVIASSEAQRQNLWALRETIPEANKRIGAIVSNDISLPLSELAGFIEAAGPEIARRGSYRVNCFGHVGDGNLHYNIFPPQGGHKADHADATDELRALVTEMVVARGGSFSAEHGVGRLKVGALERHGDPAKLAAMRAIKHALDPHGIMNPGAVLRQTKNV